MAETVPLSWFLILISLLCLLAGCALAAWSKGSRSTPPKRPPPSQPETSLSEIRSALAEVQADQAALFSTLEKLTTTVKRLSSRAGMRDSREREATASTPEAPPVGAPKAELLRHYGMAGKVGPDFARAQQALELERAN